MITRRNILRSAIAGIAAIALPASAKEEYSSERYWVKIKYGLVLAKDARGVKVFANGMDVSHVAFRADDIEGYVDCFQWEGCPNPPGEKPTFIHATSGNRRYRVAYRIVGDIEIRPKVPSWL
jgi:hypothetical protein